MSTAPTNVITNPQDLTAGKWYALGVENDDGAINWAGAMLARYDGDGCWSDENDEPVDGLFDPVLQCMVGMGSADGYVVQS